MGAVGCLFPFVLLATGAAGGGVLGGSKLAFWGAAGGFAIGIVLMAVIFWGFERARSNWPR